eukprot:TRINITY_DN3811_c0_g2_i3.p1 TRINITY_DN3811_c0_g2~~TRINITY_DN3811_c0_g2_i3.p1  ORF type:complete len:375 (-),score=18.57 TRINITY_DN3811_c0_g2_i3:533-1657(-)
METAEPGICSRTTTRSLEQQQQEDKIAVVADAASISGSSSLSDEFDLDRYRSQAIKMKSVSSSSLPQIPKIQDESQQNGNINVLGFELPLSYLKERHKDPIFLLKSMAVFYVCGAICQFSTNVFGSGYDPVLSIVASIHIIFVCLYTLSQLQSSIINGVKVDRKQMPFALPYVAGYTTLVIYSFLVKTPFNSMPLFLLAIFVTGFFFLTLNSCAQIKNVVPKYDPDYQMKFFAKRAMVGLLNVTGATDVLSDIALGVQIIQKYHGFLRYIGIVLFICCLLDFVIVNIRLTSPGEVSIAMHAWAIVLETFIIITSILAAIRIKSENADWEFILLLVFSFVSTVINFAHHIFVIVEWRLAIGRTHNQTVTFVEVFE